MCSVWFAGAWKTLAEEVPFKLGLKDGQEFTRQRRGGREFHVRGAACAKAKEIKAFKILGREEFSGVRKYGSQEEIKTFAWKSRMGLGCDKPCLFFK